MNESHSTIAPDYNVTREAISRIAQNRNWKEGTDIVTTTFAVLRERLATTIEFATDFPADLDIPVLSGPQCQGDVSVCPAHLYGAKPTFGDRLPVDGKGIEVIRGGAMNNAHTLRSIGSAVTWRPVASAGGSVALGLLTVPDGTEVYLEHPEHGFNGIAAGTYVIGRQREQAEAVRMVAD